METTFSGLVAINIYVFPLQRTKNCQTNFKRFAWLHWIAIYGESVIRPCFRCVIAKQTSMLFWKKYGEKRSRLSRSNDILLLNSIGWVTFSSNLMTLMLKSKHQVQLYITSFISPFYAVSRVYNTTLVASMSIKPTNYFQNAVNDCSHH